MSRVIWKNLLPPHQDILQQCLSQLASNYIKVNFKTNVCVCVQTHFIVYNIRIYINNKTLENIENNFILVITWQKAEQIEYW